MSLIIIKVKAYYHFDVFEKVFAKKLEISRYS